MPRYALEVKPAARKELESLSNQILGRLAPRIEGLAEEPRPRGSRKLRGYSDLWRVRIGDYRVVYIIDDEQRMVTVTRIAHRRDVYE